VEKDDENSGVLGKKNGNWGLKRSFKHNISTKYFIDEVHQEMFGLNFDYSGRLLTSLYYHNNK